MSPQDKTDLDAKVESLLGSWPAPSKDDAAWEERAASIVNAATTASRADDATLTALFAPPPLTPEEGEAGRSIASEGPTRPASGEKRMSQDSNPGSSAKPADSLPASSTVSKRPSLKELAARASQAGAASRPSGAGAGPASIPPAAASVPPAATSKPLSEAPPPRGSAPSAPPKVAEAGREDSGVVDLNIINKTATAEQIAAAEKAKPATHDLGDEGDEKAAAASDAGKIASIAEARQKKEEKKGGGAVWGILVAVVGVAAAVAIVMRGSGDKPAPTATGPEKPAVTAEAPAEANGKIAAAPEPTSTGLSVDSLPTEPTPAETAKPSAPTGGAPAEEPGQLAAAPQSTGPAPTSTGLTGPAPTIGTKPGDLSSAMAQAVGGSEKSVNADDAVPAAGGAKGGNQSVPEQPPQGSVASAVGAVMPGAKACVAGADDVSRAQITFSSSGSVSNVSVSGWAASNGQSGCVKSALKGANVGAFSKPSFTVGVTIRP